MKRSAPARNRSLARRRSRQLGTGTPAQRATFYTRTMMAAKRDDDGMQCCPVVDDGEHEGDLQAHHVISQQKLRNYALGAGLTDEEADEIAWDPANGLAVCRRHHNRHTLATKRLPLYTLNMGHIAFAARLDLAYAIDNIYREGDPDAA